MAELIEVPFGLCINTRVGPRKHVLGGMHIHWRHLANTTEASMRGGNTAFLQRAAKLAALQALY